jgi:type IV pilus assembly protein PilA
MKRVKTSKGFTLVELLVVLAIIGLLAAIGIPAILNAQRASRNTSRLKQLEAVRNSMSDYATRYNTTAGVVIVAAGTSCTTVTTNTNSASGPRACIKTGNNADTRAITVDSNNSNSFTEAASCPAVSNTSPVVFIETSSSTLTLCNEGGGQQDLTVQ